MVSYKLAIDGHQDDPVPVGAWQSKGALSGFR
jgi:hypothetical protein